jgi:hypothetical protein
MKTKHTAGGRIPGDQVDKVNARFRQQQSDLNLQYRCDACLHHDPDNHSCSLGFPTEVFGDGPHRCRTEDGALVFCKYFELA